MLDLKSHTLDGPQFTRDNTDGEERREGEREQKRKERKNETEKNDWGERRDCGLYYARNTSKATRRPQRERRKWEGRELLLLLKGLVARAVKRNARGACSVPRLGCLIAADHVPSLQAPAIPHTFIR
jgi:hypothetical protein